MSSPLPLLLQQAEDPAEADRAWSRMGSWTPPFSPSQMQRQTDHALALVRGSVRCPHDPLRSYPHKPGDGAPIHLGRCEDCGQPVEPECTCKSFVRRGEHSKRCAVTLAAR